MEEKVYCINCDRYVDYKAVHFQDTIFPDDESGKDFHFDNIHSVCACCGDPVRVRKIDHQEAIKRNKMEMLYNDYADVEMIKKLPEKYSIDYDYLDILLAMNDGISKYEVLLGLNRNIDVLFYNEHTGKLPLKEIKKLYESPEHFISQLEKHKKEIPIDAYIEAHNKAMTYIEN